MRLRTGYLLLFFAFSLVLGPICPALGDETSELESSFRQFLADYIIQVKKGNREYLEVVHPGLPREQRSFFIGITIDMMKHADENDLKPAITCRDYGICKATWPQPGGSWAAQHFIRHDGNWRWLQY